MNTLNSYKTLGNYLIDKGIWFLQTAFGVKPKSMVSSIVLGYLANILPRDKFYFADGIYYYTTLDKIKDILKYDLTNDKKWVAEKFDCSISTDTAFALGLFCADGSMSFRKLNSFCGANWRIVNANKHFLKRAQRGLKKHWQNINFDIKLYDSYKKGTETNFGNRKHSLYCLDAKGKYGERKKFLKEFYQLIYLHNKKRVPSPLFDFIFDEVKTFIEGYWAGNGRKTTKGKSKFISIGKQSRWLLEGLEWLLFGLGWDYHITEAKKEYVLRYKEIPNNERKMFCDDFSLTIRANYREYYGLNCVGEFRMVELRNPSTDAHIGWHRCNCFFAEDGGVIKFYLLEAQNDNIIEITKDNLGKLVIGNWRYVLDSADF